MRNIKEIQEEIIKLKKEKGICILAHSYQTHDILEIADFTGDSFALSKLCSEVPEKKVIMCGVRFMAETVKILSPDKKVILSHSEAGCPMAEQLTLAELKRIKKENPSWVTVAYINTTAELKTECDLCVTSASALEAVSSLDAKEILFIPDCNLGSWLESKLPEKNFHFIDGGCPVHMRITPEEVSEARKNHPEALLLVHPECKKEITDQADYAGSTTGIMKFAAESDSKEFIIGTDNSIVSHLQYAHPEKKFYALSKNCICNDMRLTTLTDVLNCLKGEAGEEIEIPDEIMKKARICIDNMLK